MKINGLFLTYIAKSMNKNMTHAYFDDKDFTIYCDDNSTISKDDVIDKLETLEINYQLEIENELNKQNQAKTNLLTKLGITEDEAKLLLS